MKKKLTLKKDTLRDLAISDLKHVVGASDTLNASDTSNPTDVGCLDMAESMACNSF